MVKTIRRQCLTRNASCQCHSEGGLYASGGGLFRSEDDFNRVIRSEDDLWKAVDIVQNSDSDFTQPALIYWFC